MVFSSGVFLYYFLTGVLVLYYLSPWRAKSLVLTLASFVFYGWWRPDFALLMLFSTVVDYVVGIRISKAQESGGRGTPWLVGSVVVQLGLLAYFKYANFGIATLNGMLLSLGHPPVAWTEVILPVGISFYTFQTMSYTIDVYRKDAPRASRFVDFACFVSLFPQLVAGPIVRYQTVADQLVARTHTMAKFFHGILFFQAGLAKKILIADMIAKVADQAFGAPSLSAPHAWLGVIAYAFQIYFDFSGYSDMAIGLGLMLGFRFPVNFDSPYKSASVTEFWRRWHISLSTWLRDYLYIPLGGNRKGRVRTYVNLSLTMLLGGLWHGANWTFVVWGAYQGFWLVIERLAGRKGLYSGLPKPAQVLVTFVITLVGWVFFRATDLEGAVRYLGFMAGAGGGTPAMPLHLNPGHVLMLVVAALVTWGAPTSQALIARAQLAYTMALQPAFLLALVHLQFQSHVPFLYFQF